MANSETETPDSAINNDESAVSEPPKIVLRVKSYVKKAYKGVGIVATLGGAYGVASLIFGAGQETLTSCVSLTPDLQAQIISKLESPSPDDITRVIQAMTCQLPKFDGNFAELDPNSETGRYANAVREVAESPKQLKRQALVLIADASTRTAGLEKLAALAVTEKDWGEVAELAYPWDVARARNALEKIIDIGSPSAWDHIYLSRLYRKSADLGSAKKAAQQGMLLTASDHDRSSLLDELGEIALAENDLRGAQDAYQEAFEISKRLARSDPKNKNYQRSLSVRLERIGGVALEQKDIPSALAAYQDALVIRKRLSESDPSSQDFQLSLYASYSHIGDVARAQQDLNLASESFEKSWEIAARLSDLDPLNANYQLISSIAHERLADIALIQGNIASAQEAYVKSRNIRTRLSESDPSNTQYQRGLYVILIKLGDLALKQGDLAQAKQSHIDALTIIKKLTTLAPSNAYYQEDMTVSFSRLGKISTAQKDLESAKNAYQSLIETLQNLRQTSPSSPIYSQQLFEALGHAGDNARARYDKSAAFEAYNEATNIALFLAQSDLTNMEYSSNLAINYARLGNLRGPDQTKYYDSAISVFESMETSKQMSAQDQKLYNALKRKVSR